MDDDEAMAAQAAIAARVGEFYENHPYPPPLDDVAAYRRSWDERRRGAESALIFPSQAYRDDRSILVAGCGTMQAVHHALRWPRARVVGIDVSATSIELAAALKRKHRLDNLELRRLAVESVNELGERFDFAVCTGVLHHLADPVAGLRAIRAAVRSGGALNVMVYAPYGRAGVYMLQEYCRRLGIGWSSAEIRDLAATLEALPADHPLVPLLRASPDFLNPDALADALLHPRDRAYDVAQFFELLDRGGFTFARWVRQAPYLPACGGPASTPHAAVLARLPRQAQYAAMELFRGTMARHSAIAYVSDDASAPRAVRFDGDDWLGFVPIAVP
ncbi:MAG: methyltransferase, partial [Candidatus Tumulicola sp.]